MRFLRGIVAGFGVGAGLLVAGCTHGRTEGGSADAGGGDCVYVMGEVQTPGRRVLSAGDSVGEVLAASGGFTDRADRAKVRLQRGGRTIRTLDCRGLELNGPSQALQGVAFRPDDMLVVPSVK